MPKTFPEENPVLPPEALPPGGRVAAESAETGESAPSPGSPLPAGEEAQPAAAEAQQLDVDEARAGGEAPRVRRRPRLRRWALAVLALCAITAIWCAKSLLPAYLGRTLSKSLSSESVAVEVRGVSIGMLRPRLKVKSIAAYPQSGERHAALSVSGVDLRLRPRLSAPGPGWLREVGVASVDFDAAAILSLPPSPAEKSENGEIPEFAPIPFSIRRVTGLGLEVRDVGGKLSSSIGEIAVEDASVSFHRRGERGQTLRGNIYVEPSAPSVEAFGSGEIDFSKLAPTLLELDCAGIAGELEKFEFPDNPPGVEVSFRWAPKKKSRSLGISVQSGPMRYCGVRLSGLAGDIRVGGGGAWSLVEIESLEIKRPEGSATGEIAIDIAGGTLSFDCVSAMDPLCFAALAGLVEADKLPEIEFDNPTELRCSGTWGIGEGGASRTAMRFSASSAGALAHGFRFSEISVSGGMKGMVLDIPEISAGAMGGSVSGSFRLDMGEGDGDGKMVSASLAVRNVPQSQWASLIGREADAKAGGILDANASFDGPLSELGGEVPKRGQGSFSIDVREANIFRVPLFAGMTDVLARFIPGVDFIVSQTAAHIDATLDEGRWNIPSLSISGAAFSVDGSGTAAADGSDLHFVARVRLLNRGTWLGRRLRGLLSPLSGLLGIRATGSLSSPSWALAPFSKSSAK